MKFCNVHWLVVWLAIAGPATTRAATRAAPVDVNLSVAPDTELADNLPAQVRIVAPRGGMGSGQVVVWADGPLAGLQATVTAVAAKQGARLPADWVSLYYGTRQIDLGPNNFHDFPWEKLARPTFDGLSEHFVPGETVQPVWITVDVPPTAEPGEYFAVVEVSGEGATHRLPLAVSVAPFVMPKVGEQRMWVSMSQSPDTLAERYQVAPWSDEHFKLLEQAFRFQGQLGHCVLYVPVITHTALGEATGLVTFRRERGQLVPDFASFERYFQLYRKHYGTPRALILGVWDPRFVDDFGTKTPAEMHLTVANEAGSFETTALPVYAAEQKPLWKAVFAGVSARAAAAGIEAKAVLLGTASDWTPLPEHFAFLKDLAPELWWATFTHGYGGTGGYSVYAELPDGPVNHGRAMDAPSQTGSCAASAAKRSRSARPSSSTRSAIATTISSLPGSSACCTMVPSMINLAAAAWPEWAWTSGACPPPIRKVQNTWPTVDTVREPIASTGGISRIMAACTGTRPGP